ncbi:MAG: hypothetical protein ACRCTZ_14830 [Sarcina sp.]
MKINIKEKFMELIIRKNISFSVIVGIIKCIEKTGKDNMIVWTDRTIEMPYYELFDLLDALAEIKVLEKRLQVYCPNCFHSEGKTMPMSSLYDEQKCSMCDTSFTLNPKQAIFCVKYIFWR